MKDERQKTGRGKKEWKFYEPLDMILGHKPATQPPVVIESGCSSMSCEQEPSSSPCPSTPSSYSTVNVSDLVQDEGVDRGDEDGPVGSPDMEESSQCERNPKKGGTYGSTSTGKKRKRSSDKFQRMECLVEKMMKQQEESDNKYVKLEEKMLEMEERRHKENQEFQMRLMSMLCNQPTVPPMPYATNYQPVYALSSPPPL